MADPLTSNIGLAVPTRGSDAGTWDTPVNNDFTSIDGLIGGLQAFTFTSGTTTLTLPAGFTATPAAGPNQSHNAILRFAGTLTGNCFVVMPRPGIYVVENRATVGANYIALQTNTTGEVIGIPAGPAIDVYSDGTNVRFRNLPPLGSMLDLCGVSTVPAWITACTVPPYLLCDGSTYNISAYPFLGAALGSTFGGNGSTTFAVPDLRGRWRIPYDGSGTRITTANSGINGTTLGAAGGTAGPLLVAANIPQLTTGFESAEHTHNFTASIAQATFGSGSFPGGATPAGGVTALSGGNNHTHNVGTTTPSNLITIPPALVFGISMIRAG